jgi:hypothetical protein
MNQKNNHYFIDKALEIEMDLTNGHKWSRHYSSGAQSQFPTAEQV